MDPFHAKLIAAASGSTLTALTMTPFDVVKTRLQTQPAAPSPGQCVRNMSTLTRPLIANEVVCIWENGQPRIERVNGFYDAVRHVWRAEGVRGLWKGSGTTLVIGVPSSTCYMLTYDHLLRNVLPSILPSSIVPLSAGVLARSAISTIASPLELIRTNLQATPMSPSQPNTLRTVLASLRHCVRTDGVLSLWRGVGPTLLRDVPFSGFYWASYEGLKRSFARRGHEGAWVAFISGASSGMAAALFTAPSDVLKTRKQVLSMAASTKVSTFSVLTNIIRTEGAAALFAGSAPRIAKIAPACGIMIASFEGFGKFLAK